MSKLDSVGAITLFIEDRQRAKSFYERTFDVEPVYEDDNAVAFQFENMVVNMLVTREAHDLIGPAVVAESDPGRLCFPVRLPGRAQVVHRRPTALLVQRRLEPRPEPPRLFDGVQMGGTAQGRQPDPPVGQLGARFAAPDEKPQRAASATAIP